MTRVVLIPSAYRPTLGGVQELTYNLAVALADAGDAVEVWTQQADEVGHTTVEWLDGITVRRFPFPLPSAKAASWKPVLVDGMRTIRDLRAAVKRFKPDVLHVQCFGPNGAYATALSYVTRIPLVVTLQGETMMDDEDIFDRSTTLRLALRAGLRHAAAVTGCSAFTLRDAETRFGLQPGRGQVIFNGVDPSLEPGSDPDHQIAVGTPPDGIAGPYVLALGRAVDKKGFDLLIQAFALIADRHPEVVLAIGGDGPALPTLSRLIEQLGVQRRVTLLGRLSRPQVAAAMASAEIFVMPSRLEPFGIVVLEAWRAGRPVVATSRGGAPEFVDEGVTGTLVDPFDTPKLAETLDRLLAEPARRDAFGQAGRRRVSDFYWPAIAPAYEQCYAPAIRASRRAAR
jgi:glycogen(starch) synthase